MNIFTDIFSIQKKRLMYFIPAGNVYFVMSFTCRAVTGIGSSMASSYAVVGYYYPHNIAKIIVTFFLF